MIGRVSFVLLCILALTAAAAQIGGPPVALLAELSEYAPSNTGDERFTAADSFEFGYELRGGAVYEITGGGLLNAENIAFMSQLVAAGTGYGDSIATPVATFLSNRASDLAGQGEAAIGVEEFQLALEVSGDSQPYSVSFALRIQEVPAEIFPAARHTLGPADARFVIREFSDFQCPYCAAYATQVLPAVKDRLLERGDVRFEFHHFPLVSIHPNALPAAEAAECVVEANSAEDFWPYHDALFERQRAWQGLGDPLPYFARLAGEIGLSAEGVPECLAEGRYRSEVQAAYAFASGQLRLTGTPSVFLNGYKVQNYLDMESYLELIELVDVFADE